MYLNIISGASGCGKTTLLNGICAAGLAEKAPKFSERPFRGEGDDIIHVDNIEEARCDLLYVINERRYGLDTKLIRSKLDEGRALAIILSDLRLVRRLKNQFGERARSLYISSGIDEDRLRGIHLERHPFKPTRRQRLVLSRQFSRLGSAARLEVWPRVVEAMTQLFDEWNNALPESASIKVRAQKIRLFHDRYVENLPIFDHVLLNYRSPEDLIRQFRNLSAFKAALSPSRLYRYPPVFIVCASSGAGKGTLMENLNIMGSDEIVITSKQAKRAPKPADKRDGMIAIGENGKFSKDYDWHWTFHKGKHFKGVEYAVSMLEIQKNIDAGIPQIFISNMGQIENAKRFYRNHAVLVYLHATRTEREMREYQYRACKTRREANERLKEITKVHEDYIKQIASFDHVLLNTTFPEDLYDQMYRLVEYYKAQKKVPT